MQVNGILISSYQIIFSKSSKKKYLLDTYLKINLHHWEKVNECITHFCSDEGINFWYIEAL